MENRLNSKAQLFVSEIKNELLEKLGEIKSDVSGDKYDNLLMHVNSIKPMMITKEDFMKRKRTKNKVCLSERCIAKRANGEQCSRRKRGDSSYCGTHIKGVPHGVVSMEETEVVSQKEVWCEDIAGIIQYIDKDGNIYKHEDVMNNVVNPSIIGKYEIVADKYVIRQD
jgi:hypothetical protein